MRGKNFLLLVIVVLIAGNLAGSTFAIQASLDEEGWWKNGLEAAPDQAIERGAAGASLPMAVVEASLVVQNGDTPPGGGGNPVTVLNSPFTNGNGQVGFTGAVNDGSADNFVWLDAAIVWRNSAWPTATLGGAESTMGVGNNGEFIYSPSFNGDDAVWTHNGLLQVEGMPAPGFPPGITSTFHSRPTLLPGGQAYWVSGFDEDGGGATDGRMLYTSPNAMSSTVSVVLRSDDIVGGLPIDRPSGIGFDYQISDNGSHHIHVLLLDTGSTVNDGALYVDGSVIARESFPIGGGENWGNFDVVSISDSGNYIFTGDTDGSTATDEFIAYNGVIAVREGDVIGGLPLTTTATLRAASLNNLNQAVHAWGIAGGTPEVLFFACDAANLGESSLLLSTGDMVDLDGNGSGDATVTDFNAATTTGPGLWLAEDGYAYIEVDLDYGSGDVEAIIRLALPLCSVVDVSIHKTAAPLAAAPGATLTYTLAFSNVGTALASGVIITDVVPVSLTVQSVISHGVMITATQAGQTYTWMVQDLAPGAGGVITLTGVLSQPLAAGTFANLARITAAEDQTPGNNTSVAQVLVQNVAPVAVDDGYSVMENAILTVAAPGVLGNDADANGDSLAAAPAIGPSHGALALQADGSFVYTPTLNFWGPDSFGYVASDGALTGTATVFITVTPGTVTTYTLTYQLVGSGAVTLDPPGGVYAAGTLVTLTATADLGWAFAGWSGALSGATSPVTLTMDANKAVTATFEALTYILDVAIAPTGSGMVEVEPPGPYYYGDVVTLTATANLGWAFAGWSGALSGATSPITLTMDANKAVTATFDLLTYTLDVNVAPIGGGAVNVDPPGPYYYGDVVTLTATANLGWAFAGWSGALSGATSPITLTMDANKAVTAMFEPVYQIYLPLVLRNWVAP